MKKGASSMASLVLNSGDLEPVEYGVSGLFGETPSERRRRLRRRKELRRARLVGDIKLAIVCCTILCLWLYVPSVYRLSQIRQEISSLQAQYYEWQQKNAQVMADISYASTDEFVRRAARETLGLVDRGAILYVASLPEVNDEPTSVKPDTGEQSFAMSVSNVH